MSGAEAALTAARLDDEIVHGWGLLGMVAGAIVGAVVAATIIAGTAVTGGLLLVAIVGGCIAGGGLAGGALARGISKAANLSGPTTGRLARGSPNVTVNDRAAMRAGVDYAGGCNGLPINHFPIFSPVRIAEGSKIVTVNGKPMARLSMKMECGAKIKTGSPCVTVGGPTARVLTVIDTEEIFEGALMVLGFVSLGAGGIAAFSASLGAGLVFTGINVGSMVGMEALHSWGESLGPGYGDIMVGVAGFALLAASAKAAQSNAGRRTLNHLDPDGAVPRDRSAISRLSERGDIDGARDILKPHVDKGDIPGIVDRLDVSSPRDGGYLWSGDKAGAARIAESRGGVTLETTKGGRVVDDWGYLSDRLPWDKGGKDFWGGVSEKYAGQLSGDVTALQTPDKAGGGYIFKTYEWPKVRDGLGDGRITSFTQEIIGDTP